MSYCVLLITHRHPYQWYHSLLPAVSGVVRGSVHADCGARRLHQAYNSSVACLLQAQHPTAILSHHVRLLFSRTLSYVPSHPNLANTNISKVDLISAPASSSSSAVPSLDDVTPLSLLDKGQRGKLFLVREIRIGLRDKNDTYPLRVLRVVPKVRTSACLAVKEEQKILRYVTELQLPFVTPLRKSWADDSYFYTLTVSHPLFFLFETQVGRADMLVG